MKKLVSPLVGLALAAGLLLFLFGRVAIVSAQVHHDPKDFVQPANPVAAETNHLVLVASQAFTVYLPVVYAPEPPSPKKGVGMIGPPACADVENLRTAWYLNWSVSPDSSCDPTSSAKFVPRIYGASQMALLTQAIANAQASGWLIGFSEPNLPWQGNMSPAQGATLWKQIEDAAIPAGIKLVSPSPNQYNPGQVDPHGHQWLWAMVEAYKTQNGGQPPHFDAIGWNIYKQTPAAIETYLTARHNEALARGYDVPIWVLEFGGECWNSANGNTGNQSIMTTTPDWFDATPWIGRYAWFANRITGKEAGAPGWQSCSLVNPKTGGVTSLGQLYSTY
jgi:hypothetical protein